MSYKYHEINYVQKLSDLTPDEQEYIRKEWNILCAREKRNTSEYVFMQKQNGRFIRAERRRISSNPYYGCGGGYWKIQYGSCKCWGMRKDVLGWYNPEPVDKLFSALILQDGERIQIPDRVHTKKDVLELATKLGFEL